MVSPDGSFGRLVAVILGGPQAVRRYVLIVSLGGLATLTLVVLRSGVADVASAPGAFWLFTVFVVIGELFPITVPRRDEVEEITTSTTFAFAVMMGLGTGAAVIALTVASALADFAYRKPAWKTVFNVGQYAISMAAAGAVYAALDGPREPGTGMLVPFLAAAVTFFALNDVLTGVGVGLAQGVPILRYLARDLVFQASTAAALLALSPIALLVADFSLLFVPLLAVPVAAVYWGATASLENTRLVSRLEDSLEHLTELNRMKDDFVAVVSHELRTPLTSIQGYVKTLLQLGEELGDEQRRSFLEAADRQSDRLRRLIEQLLVVARLESHVEPLTLSSVELREIADHVVDELRGQAHGHVFDLRFPPDLPAVETDEGKVHQILSNLVENALKYSPPDTRILIRAETADDGVSISVADEGPGIPEELQDRVFDRFYQIDQSITRRVGGTGLGLYICRKMAETLDARLWLDRSGRHGSVFCLWLPRTPPTVAGDPLEEVEQARRVALATDADRVAEPARG
jgi:signal transduction histidine kinase